MTSLIAACAVFFLIHTLVSGTGLRAVIVGAIGEKVYRALFSVASLGGIVWMATSYNRVAEVGSNYLWNLGYLGYSVGMLLMYPALLYVVIGGRRRTRPPCSRRVC